MSRPSSFGRCAGRGRSRIVKEGEHRGDAVLGRFGGVHAEPPVVPDGEFFAPAFDLLSCDLEKAVAVSVPRLDAATVLSFVAGIRLHEEQGVAGGLREPMPLRPRLFGVVDRVDDHIPADGQLLSREILRDDVANGLGGGCLPARSPLR